MCHKFIVQIKNTEYHIKYVCHVEPSSYNFLGNHAFIVLISKSWPTRAFLQSFHTSASLLITLSAASSSPRRRQWLLMLTVSVTTSYYFPLCVNVSSILSITLKLLSHSYSHTNNRLSVFMYKTVIPPTGGGIVGTCDIRLLIIDIELECWSQTFNVHWIVQNNM